jgi:hypothetical protein
MNMAICKICTSIKGKENLLVSKLNSLIKHFGLKKCIKARPRIVVGELYICPTNVHVPNKKLYAFKGRDNVVVQVANGDMVERKNKYLQFVSIFHLLQQGKPMTNFEACKYLFQFLKVENCPRKHWSDTTGWTMVEAMHGIVLRAIKVFVQTTYFILVSCDEVMTLDNQSWLSVHVYVVEQWRRVLVLLNL